MFDYIITYYQAFVLSYDLICVLEILNVELYHVKDVQQYCGMPTEYIFFVFHVK